MAEAKVKRHFWNRVLNVIGCKFATNLFLNTLEPSHKYKGTCELDHRLPLLEDMMSEKLQKNEENSKENSKSEL